MPYNNSNNNNNNNSNNSGNRNFNRNFHKKRFHHGPRHHGPNPNHRAPSRGGGALNEIEKKFQSVFDKTLNKLNEDLRETPLGTSEKQQVAPNEHPQQKIHNFPPRSNDLESFKKEVLSKLDQILEYIKNKQ